MVKVTSKLKTKDRGKSRILGDVEKFRQKPVVKVGIQGRSALAKKTKGNMSVVDVAVVQEFGSEARKIKARPLFRNTVALNREKWNLAKQKLAGEIIAGRISIQMGLQRLGQLTMDDFKRYFTSPGFASTIPNSLQTQQRKQSTVPLIDTGQERSAVTFVVEMNGLQVKK